MSTSTKVTERKPRLWVDALLDVAYDMSLLMVVVSLMGTLTVLLQLVAR